MLWLYFHRCHFDHSCYSMSINADPHRTVVSGTVFYQPVGIPITLTSALVTISPFMNPHGRTKTSYNGTVFTVITLLNLPKPQRAWFHLMALQNACRNVQGWCLQTSHHVSPQQQNFDDQMWWLRSLPSFSFLPVPTLIFFHLRFHSGITPSPSLDNESQKDIDCFSWAVYMRLRNGFIHRRTHDHIRYTTQCKQCRNSHGVLTVFAYKASPIKAEC